MSDPEAELPAGKNIDLEDAYVDEYWSAYRQHVHTLLAWGYADSRHRVQSKHEEPDITGFIAEAIQDRLDAPDSPTGVIILRFMMTLLFVVEGEQDVDGGDQIWYLSYWKESREQIIISKQNGYVNRKAKRTILKKVGYNVFSAVCMLPRVMKLACSAIFKVKI